MTEYKYFIAYNSLTDGGHGSGNVQLNLKEKIDDIKDLKEISQIIKDNHKDIKEVAITNFILLKETSDD